jgi:hypothetical protein
MSYHQFKITPENKELQLVCAEEMIELFSIELIALAKKQKMDSTRNNRSNLCACINYYLLYDSMYVNSTHSLSSFLL